MITETGLTDDQVRRAEYLKQYNKINKAKLSQQKKEWAKNNQDKVLKCDMTRHYGEKAYDNYIKAYEEQIGCCKICGKYHDRYKNRLVYDHNHKSGDFRSLLCNNCNKALGLFCDSSELLSKASNYLLDHQHH